MTDDKATISPEEMERFSAMMVIAKRAAQRPVFDPRRPDEIIYAQRREQPAMTGDPKPTISAEEAQRRREHVGVAIADNRIEGMIATSTAEQEVFDAYIRGEIEAGDLVTAYQRLTQGAAYARQNPERP